MKLALAVVVASGLVSSMALAQDPGARKSGRPAGSAAVGDAKDLNQKAGYSYGYGLGRNLKAQGIPLDPKAIAKGMADALGGVEPEISEEEMKSVLQEFAKQIQEKQAGMAGTAAATNKAAGEKFLAANKTKPGVVTLPSGLQYKVIKQGNGPKPSATDTVTVHYEGKLINGKIFDSSLKRGEPTSFPVNGVIAGWTEALQLMPVGSTWQLFIPSELAYGERPRPGGPIGPNDVLTFEVQLLKIGE